ncbi:MAG: 2-oxoacid:acceptor oxidoreductase subunit alpha [bacterium]
MFNCKIAGLAGEGIAVTGTLFAKLCMRHGLHVFTYGEYPSLIRGGHNTIQVTADKGPVTSQAHNVDVLIALNQDAILLHLEELTAETIILVDQKQVKLDWANQVIPGTIIDLPMFSIAVEVTGSPLASNMVSLGATCYLLGLDIAILHELITHIFTKKGEEVVSKNKLAATRGYQHLESLQITRQQPIVVTQEQQVYVSGNESIGLGAIAGGLQFYAAYPMTPATSLLEFLAAQQSKYTLVVKHSEDEISAINQAIGASFAGIRAMVATSGGGFALMAEAASLAAMVETPLVVMEGQRPGPATGQPTWTGQSDLQFVLNAGHGDFGKVVIAPGDAEEAFVMTRLAFLVAEQWQTQVYILADKYLLESSQSVPKFATQYTNNRYNMVTGPLPADNSFQRYQITPQGYSIRSIPGDQHGVHIANSYEHNEYGIATEDPVLATQMADKRLHKLASTLQVLPMPKLIGPAEAEITFVTWGSTKLPIQETIKQLNAIQKNKANAIHLTTMAPFPVEAFTKLAANRSRLIMVEGNATRQAERLIREATGIIFNERINRYDGRPFYPEDIVNYINQGAKQ